jgi:inner membrane protein
MENLTHTLTGLMLSRAAFNRRLPYATPILLIAANIPDIDIVTLAGGPLAYLNNHRGITHAFAFLPVMAILSVLIVIPFTLRKGAWRKNWLRALIAAGAGVLSHVLLDWTNVYGIRMLLPFSGDWLRLDITNIIDIWIWVILLLGVAAPVLSRLVSSEIGARQGTGRPAAITVLILLAGYEYGRFLLHQRAVATFDARLYQGAAPIQTAALPDGFNPARWTGLIQGNGYFLVVPMNLLSTFDPGEGATYYQADAPHAVAAAKATETFGDFLRFSQFPLWRVIPVDKPEGGLQVTVTDMRFGAPQDQRFAASALLDSSLRVISAGFSFGPAPPQK